VNDTHRLTPAVALLFLLAGFALFGFFHWRSRASRQDPTASQLAAPFAQNSARSEIAQPLIESSTPSRAETSDTIKLAVTPAETKAPLGENSVEIVVKMAGRQALSGGVVTLIYNPSIIEVTGVYPVKAPAPFTVTPRIENSQGWVTVSLTPTGAKSQQNPASGLFTVQFMPIDTGRSEVALMAGSFTDAKGSSIPVELNNGTVEVFIRE
jgi:hypothetical protein